MRIQVFQHVDFEGPAYIAEWAKKKSYSIQKTLLFKNEELPEIESFDLLVMMGGPMNIYEHNEYPWLPREKKLIKEAIEKKKCVLGICLGAQLLADVLGGPVTKNHYKEIGWFPVRPTVEARSSKFFDSFPEEFVPLHWHGDTFEIPKGAKRIAGSPACPNQVFEFEERVVGLQFHLESTKESIEALLRNCQNDMTPGPFVQHEEIILKDIHRIQENNALMGRLLEGFESMSHVNAGNCLS